MRPPRLTVRLTVLVALAAGASSVAGEAGPADPLLRLVPPDAAVTLAVEDLRGNVREFFGSPLAEHLRRLPAVQNWLASDRVRQLRAALGKVEEVLGEKLVTVRDELLGEAVVLVLRQPPGGRPEEARGLLLVRVPDRPLLDRLVAGLNAAQARSGELRRVSDRVHDGVTYRAREFQPRTRPDEFYAMMGDRVFAWSNSEDLIREAIDRQAGGDGGLGKAPEFRSVRDRLPSRAAVSLFVDPRYVRRLLAAAPRPKTPGEEQTLALLARYLGAVRYAGAAAEWRDGVIVHTEAAVDPSKLSPSLKRWADPAESPRAPLRRVPASALLMVSGWADAPSLLDALESLTAEPDRPKLDNLLTALSGTLLGLDARSEVLPHLGPNVLGYLERPEPQDRRPGLPAVLTVDLGGAKVADAVDNAARTMLAVYALDPKHQGGRLRLDTRTADGVKVTALSPSTPFAYAVHDGRLILATSPEAVARALAAQADPRAGDRFERLRAALFPDAQSFACADLRAVHDFAGRHRAAIAGQMAAKQKRPEAETARDLDQALALLGLFDAAFATGTVEPGFTGVYRTFGLARLPAPRP